MKLTTTGAAFLEHALRIADATRRALEQTRAGAPSEDRIPAHPPARRGRKPKDRPIAV